MSGGLAIGPVGRAVALALAAALAAPGAQPAWAQPSDSKLQRLETWSQSHGWEAVGLLILDGRASCTGTLVRADIVLTAGHCLYDHKTGTYTDPRRVQFRAGWRNGRAVAVRWGKTALVDPGFVSASGQKGLQIRNDLALIRLKSPIPSTHARPFPVGGHLSSGETVSVVSYGAGRNDAPSRQARCEVLDTGAGLAAFSCSVVHGSSGAPVFSGPAGRVKIASVISSMAEVDGKPVAFGMDATGPVSRLLADMRAGRGVYPAHATGARRLSVGARHTAGGARFLKP